MQLHSYQTIVIFLQCFASELMGGWNIFHADVVVFL